METYMRFLAACFKIMLKIFGANREKTYLNKKQK